MENQTIICETGYETNEYADDSPTHFLFHLTPEIIARVLVLQQFIKDNEDVVEVEITTGCITLLEELYNEEEAEEDDEIYTQNDKIYKRSSMRYWTELLLIHQDRFYGFIMEKHDATRIESAALYLIDGVISLTPAELPIEQ